MELYADMFEVLRVNKARFSRMRNIMLGSLVPMMMRSGLPAHFATMGKRIESSDDTVYLLLPIRDAELLVAYNIDDSYTVAQANTVRDMLVDAYRDQSEHILLKVG